MKKLLLFAGILLFVSFTALAQMKKGDPQAHEIIDKYLAAIGGKEKLGKIKTWVIKGKIEQNGIQAPVTYFLKYDKIRMEVEVIGQKFIQAFDGNEAWDLHPFEGKGQARYSVNQNLDVTKILALVYPIYLIGKNRNNVTYGGLKMLDNKKVHIINLTNDYKTDYFFDAETFLLLERKSSNGAITKFGKYLIDDSEGLKIPQLVNIINPNMIILNDIRAGVNLSDSLFSFPENTETTLFNKYSKFITKGQVLPKKQGIDAPQIVKEYAKINQDLYFINQMRIKGNFYFNKSKKGIPLEGYLKLREDKSRLEMNMMGKTFVLVTNGDLKWEINPFKSTSPKLIQDEKDNSPLKLTDADLLNYKERGHKIEYTSREYIGKTLCHKIKLLKKTGEEIYFFIGVTDFNIYKQSLKDENNGASFYLNFKKVDGVLTPHIFYEINEENKQHIIVEIDKYTFNQPIDDKIFEFPGKEKKKTQKEDKKD